MASTYQPAVFQPTVRPSWAGIISYIPPEEAKCILEAIIRFPEDTGIKSVYFEQTIKPDLSAQYEKFVRTCESRGRGARTYWGEHKLSLSNTYDEHMDNFLKDKDKDKDEDKGKSQSKSEDKSNTPNIINKEDLIKRMGELIKKTPKGGLYE